MLLKDDHSYLHALLNEVIDCVDVAEYRDDFEKLDLFWARLAMHIRAEHLHLFPSIVSRCEGAQSASSRTLETIERLRDDHDFFMHGLAGAIKSLRAANDENAASTWMTIRDQLIDLGKRLNEHDRIEETEVYPLLETLMDGVEFDHLVTRMQRELDNLPPRFRIGNSD